MQEERVDLLGIVLVLTKVGVLFVVLIAAIQMLWQHLGEGEGAPTATKCVILSKFQ